MFIKKRFLPYGCQWLRRAEYRAVQRVLKSRFLTQGPMVERFESALKQVTGALYAVAVANGTVALDLAVRAVKMQRGIPDGSPALTTANTFVASSNTLLYNDLNPIFCDISQETYNLNLAEVERLLAAHNWENPSGEAAIELLLPVHFAGVAVEMPKLLHLAQKYGPANSPLPSFDSHPLEEAQHPAAADLNRLAIVEDAAHALGSFYWQSGEFEQDGSAVGSCHYSDACCFSFHPVKTATTAEGGAITCRDPELYQILLHLRNHGMVRDAESWQYREVNCEECDAAVPPWYYEIQTLGYNARLSDIHAALGVEQLRHLGAFAQQRRYLTERYSNALQGLKWLRTPHIGAHTCPHLYVVQIDFGYLRLSRTEAMTELQEKGIGTQVHYIPLPMQPYYRKLGYSMAGLENTAKYYRKTLSLPLYPSLRQKDQNRVIQAVLELGELADP